MHFPGSQPKQPSKSSPPGHATASGTAASILAHFFGENTALIFHSDTMAGVTRSFSSFTAATTEVNDARIYGGIHFRIAVNGDRTLSRQVAGYILDNTAHRVHGRDDDVDGGRD